MILVDTNLLIYAHVPSSVHHVQARKWFEKTVDSGTPMGLPWHSLIGFLRITTSRRVFEEPQPLAVAWSVLTGWLELGSVWIPEPKSRHSEILGRLLRAPGMHPRLIHDAHLAAIAIEHDLTLCSMDGDFARFPGLRWNNPLVVQ